MKKLVAILLMLTYAVSAIGGRISLNYCGNDLNGVSFSALADFRCCCTDEIDADCCDENVITIKKTDVHQPFQYGFSLHAPIVADLPVLYFPLDILQPAFPSKQIKYPLRPPPLLERNSSLFLLHSVFRI